MPPECSEKHSMPQQWGWLCSRLYSSQIHYFFFFLIWLSFKLEQIHFFKKNFFRKKIPGKCFGNTDILCFQNHTFPPDPTAAKWNWHSRSSSVGRQGLWLSLGSSGFESATMDSQKVMGLTGTMKYFRLILMLKIIFHFNMCFAFVYILIFIYIYTFIFLSKFV